MNLVDIATRKAVRVSVKPEVMKSALASPFVKMRHQGVPPTEVPLDVSRPLVEKLLGRSNEELFTVSGLFEYALPARTASCFETVNCSRCGELVAENKVRLKEGKPVCLPCSGY